MEIKYFKVCRVRCNICDDVLEHVNRSKHDNSARMMWCSCGKIGLDPSACFYRIVGNGTPEGSFEDAFEDLSEEWEE